MTFFRTLHNRELKNYVSRESYFLSEISSDKRFHNQLADPMTEIYFHRIQSVLKELPGIVNTLEEQFLAYQSMSLDDFPKEI